MKPGGRPGSLRAGRGAVLLLSLLVMFSVIIAAAGLSSLILRSLQQTRTIDNAMLAFYAAETAVEEALYYARESGELPPSHSDLQMLSNGSGWSRQVSGTELALTPVIPQDTVYEVALYDPDQETVATDITTIEMDWTDDCGDCSVLTATLVGWLPGGSLLWEPNAATYNYIGGSASLPLGPSNRLYKLRLRAQRADIQMNYIKAYDGGGALVPLPGRIKIDAIGEYSDVRQQLSVTLPRRAPLAGIYEFVIFSECSLVKGGPISCP
ncbi:hypothetical protein AMJ57_02855 [Parcubacteria bacterium SG8_24]|nr:MAG: hypothetical protein AMJ57_02855 [Parcubacteria bacterium SG8_24]